MQLNWIWLLIVIFNLAYIGTDETERSKTKTGSISLFPVYSNALNNELWSFLITTGTPSMNSHALTTNGHAATTAFPTTTEHSTGMNQNFTITKYEMGPRWISISFTDYNNETLRNLTKIKFTIKMEEASNTSFLNFPTCFTNSTNEIFHFNTSTTTCADITIQPCGLYNITLTPIYTSFNGSSNSISTSTPPGIEELGSIHNLTSGPDWISFDWNFTQQCETKVNFMNLTFKSDDETKQKTINFNCFDRLHGILSYNTTRDKCSVSLSHCKMYDVQLLLALTNDDIAQLESHHFTTGGNDGSVILNSIEVGETWFIYSWEPTNQCRNAISSIALQLNGRGQITEANLTLHCFNFSSDQLYTFDSRNTSCVNITIEQCSNYTLSITPIIFNSSYENETSAELLSPPGSFGNSTIINIDADDRSISFTWKTTEKCNEALSSVYFRLTNDQNITQTEKINTTCFIQESNGFYSFNTTENNCAKFTVEQCTSYIVELKPVFFNEFNGSSSSKLAHSRPGDLGYITLLSNLTGSDWMSFTFNSTPCQSAISSLSMNITIKNSFKMTNNQVDIPMGCAQFNEDNTFTIQSNKTCFPFNISSCSYYFIIVTPIYFELYSGINEEINAITAPGNLGNIANLTIFNQGEKQFELGWRSPICNLVTEYELRLATNALLNRPENKYNTTVTVPVTCLNQTSGNTSLIMSDGSCGLVFQIDSCTSYIIGIQPRFLEYNSTKDEYYEETISYTLPGIKETMAQNFSVSSAGNHWFILSWTTPGCTIGISSWNFQMNNDSFSLSYECPLLSNSNTFQVNISNPIFCQKEDNPIPLPEIAACSNYIVQLNGTFLVSEINGETTEANVSTQFDSPGIVLNLKSQNRTNNSIQLEWDAPTQNKECLTTYNARLYLHSTGEKLCDTNTSTNNVRFTKLNPCTQYNATITSMGTYHSGLSTSIVLSTAGRRPDPAEDLKVDYNTSSIKIWWDPPSNPICKDGYEVLLFKQNILVHNETTTSEMLVIREKELEEGFRYYIYVTTYKLVDGGRLTGDTINKTVDIHIRAEPNVTGIALGITIPLIIFAILGAVFYKSRPARKFIQDTVNSIGGKPNIPSKTHGIPIYHLTDVLRELTENARSKLYEEFRSLEPIPSETPSCSIATLALNKEKNRYSNILPYDRYRVKLGIVHGDQHSDYINASYIGKPGDKNYFIACQGPKESTIVDFWRMVWEQDVSVIVMLTKLNENAKDKCAKYWPNGDSTFGDIIVTLESETTDHVTLRDFRLQMDNNNKLVRQYHYTSWPDFGCPDNPKNLIDLIMNVRQFHSQQLNNDSPIVVHCSAGVGRSGTYIGLELLMEQAKNKEEINVHETVKNLRICRMSMVQTEEQYFFLYKSIHYYVENYLRN